MLTDLDCKRASCPADKRRVRLTDAHGLYLEVSPTSKRWFWKFYPDGKESRMALGAYPEVGLKAARLARDEARLQWRAKGINPVVERKAARLAGAIARANTFELVARELHLTKASGWSSTYAARWIDRMQRDLFPWIGAMPLDDITAPVLLGALNRVVKRGAIETAHSLRQWSGQVFRYGVATGRCQRNIVADLVDALPPLNVKSVSAILQPAAAGQLLRDIDAYPGQLTTRVCMQLSALLWQRPGNMRAMRWEDLDLAEAMWAIPSEAMKRTVAGKLRGSPHHVPLPRQAIALLEEVRPLTGSGTYVFPAMTDKAKPLSENTVRVALRRMGYTNEEHTPHGFRAMARTLLVERLGFADGVVEAQLAHAKSGPLGAAYDRAEYMAQRREMMQRWADYLDQLRNGGKVISLRA